MFCNPIDGQSKKGTSNFKLREYKDLFESVVIIVFQSAFHAEIHQNNIFLFFKNYFWDQRIKTIQNI